MDKAGKIPYRKLLAKRSPEQFRVPGCGHNFECREGSLFPLRLGKPSSGFCFPLFFKSEDTGYTMYRCCNAWYHNNIWSQSIGHYLECRELSLGKLSLDIYSVFCSPFLEFGRTSHVPCIVAVMPATESYYDTSLLYEWYEPKMLLAILV
ncbi:hypothetical protein CEXT_31691 [Caerostris extrusa]|uniref:Uncharacterized protein n=1 Tax=Caerostris extrusa TaxID=172846 RepID=A0AAV4YG54_CAEEX|nr:hypothetical protein CEXT_31691 [Caerostris extrusa]